MTYRIQNFALCQNAGAWKATADICFGAKVVVYGVRVVQYNGKPPFVRFPDKKVGAQHQPIVSFSDPIFRRKVCLDLLQLYHDATERGTP